MAAGKVKIDDVEKHFADHFKDKDLRVMWKKMKTQALQEVKNDKEETATLKKIFDRGLGPLLDTWAKQTRDLSKTSKSALHSTSSKIVEIVKSYDYEVTKMAKHKIVLQSMLHGISLELKRQEDWLRRYGGF